MEEFKWIGMDSMVSSDFECVLIFVQWIHGTTRQPYGFDPKVPRTREVHIAKNTAARLLAEYLEGSTDMHS